MKKTQITHIKNFLIENAYVIQRQATQHHKKILGGDTFRSEAIEKYQENHIKVVQQLAKHLLVSDVKNGSAVFKRLAKTLAKDSVRDQLTIEEATDGIIFLKQIIWKSLKEKGFLQQLTTDEFYRISQTTGTYVDIVVSKIAFEYHAYYSERKEKQEKLKNKFIGMASHELKTPVTSIKAFAQVLQNRFAKAGDAQSARLLMKMDSQLDKLNGLIEDLLAVTKIETGKLQLNKRLFAFSELVHEICEEMQLTTEKHKIIMDLDTTKSLYGDRDRLGQVITNMLTNAIKYSPNADKILVTSKVETNEIILCVTDFGVGIPKSAQEKVFDQFYRVTGKSEETFSGMGLGLYVSAEIVKRHHGRIWVESAKDRGSTFCFSLPLVKKEDKR